MTRDKYLSRFERWVGGSKQRKVAARAELEEHLSAAERAGDLEAAMRRLGDPRAAARDFSAGYGLTPSPIPQRFAAALIDLGVLAALIATGLAQGTWAATRQGGAQDVALNVAGKTKHLIEMPLLGIALIVLGGLWLVAFWVLEWRTGRTLGKAALGLRIVSEDGTAASFWQIVVRNLTLVFSGPLQLFDWGFVFFNPKHQRAFDIVAKTMVVLEGGSARRQLAPAPSL
jgi:uncharacterized RDD family membrane protein YckC